MATNNQLLLMTARGANPGIADAMYRGRMQGLRQRNALAQHVNTQEDRNALRHITDTLSTGGIDAAIGAGAGSTHLAEITNLQKMRQAQKKALADQDFRHRSLEATTDYRNQSLDIARGRLAQTRRQQDPNREYAAREQAALQFGLQPDTPDYQSYVLTGKIPKSTGVAVAKPTVDSAKAAGFYDRMQAAEAVFSSQGATDAAQSRLQRGMHQLPFGNNMVSEDFQRFDQARRDFVNAILRRESGAVISDAEFENAARQYFPQPGDSAAVIQQKARNRRIAIEGIRRSGQPSLGPQSEQQTPAQWQDIGNGVRLRRVGSGNNQQAPALPQASGASAFFRGQ